MFKVNNRNARTRCEICSKLTIKAPERHHFIVNFEHVSHLVLMFLLLTLSRQMPAGYGPEEVPDLDTFHAGTKKSEENIVD